MNNEQIKEKLLQIENPAADFSVVLSGKGSKKVNGLYKPEEGEIVIHNKNFTNDNLLMYTAIHEYAHHLHFCSPDPPKSARSHTRRFWSILHSLLIRAEEIGVYRSIFEEDERFIELTRRIKEQFITTHGSIMKELGRVLAEAKRLCAETGTRFEDYVERVLQIERSETTHLLRVGESDLPEEIGYENMKFLSRVKEPQEREEALQQLQGGATPDMLKERFNRSKSDESQDPQERLLKEKERILKNMEKLTHRLEEIDRELEEG
ncbi:MAG: hypothetical protein ACLFQW_12635 [Spirochaetaceae bacterium]